MRRMKTCCALAFLTAITSGPTWAMEQSTTPQSISEPLIRWIFTVGIIAITVSWISIPILFAWQGKLEEMLDLIRRGTVMRFVTVTYIVLVVVTLALIGRLDGDKVATILASIAGYVLGQTTQRPQGKAADKGTQGADDS